MAGTLRQLSLGLDAGDSSSSSSASAVARLRFHPLPFARLPNRMTSKVLALGPPAGPAALPAFLGKLRALEAKHGFTLALVVGDFFGPAAADDDSVWEALLDGKEEVPLPTYITSSGRYPLPARVAERLAALPAAGGGGGNGGKELCRNLFFIANTIVTLPGTGGLTLGALASAPPAADRRAFLGSPHIPLEQPQAGASASAGGGGTAGAGAGGGGASSFAALQAAALALKRPSAATGGGGGPPAEPQGIDLLLLGSPPARLLASSPACPPALKAAAARAGMRLAAPAAAPGDDGSEGEGEGEVDELVRRARARYLFFPPPPPSPPLPPPTTTTPTPSGSTATVDDGSSSGGSSATQIFFEREPYPSDPSPSPAPGDRPSPPPPTATTRLTRALQLAPFVVAAAAAATAGAGPTPPTKPQRSFYAFNLGPLPPPLPAGAGGKKPPPSTTTATATTVVPANTTPNPFAVLAPAAAAGAGGGRGLKRPREPLEEQGFIWGKMPGSGPRGRAAGGGGGRGGRPTAATGGGGGGGERRERKEPIMMAECWFCLSNPQVTKHLIVGIHDEVYVTLPKGPLVPAPNEGRVVLVGGAPVVKDKEEGVPGGGHVLIIPISHHPTIASIPADEKPAVNAEIGSVLGSLRALYGSYGHVGVGFEVGRLTARGGHAHIQLVPVPERLAGEVEQAFRTEGATAGLAPFEEAERLEAGGEEGRKSYFRLLLPDGRQLVSWLGPRQRFDLQFGRSVLANLLGTPDRLDWKACLGTGGEPAEKRDATAFKKAYERFDASG